MKKYLVLITFAAFLLSSCYTTMKTARTAEIGSSLQNATVADLEVTGERFSYTMTPSKEIQRGGLSNVKRAAEAGALETYKQKTGKSADVLVEPQYVISKKRTFLGSKITSISVSGRPAHYTNFRSLNDSVWTNPVFRGVKVKSTTPSNGLFSRFGSKNSAPQYAEAKVKGPKGYRGRGFAGHSNLILASAENEMKNGDSEGDTDFNVLELWSLGYQFNPHWYLGGGLGFCYNDEFESSTYFVPIFVNGRYYFKEGKFTPFIDCKLGYNMCTKSDYDGGIFLGGAIGICLGHFEIAFQALRQDFEMDADYHYDYGKMEFETTSLGVSLGFNF